MKAVRVKANSVTLVVKLGDMTGQKNDRVFVMPPNRSVVIPADYAAGLFNNPSIVRWYEYGKLSIQGDVKELQEKSLEEGYITEKVEKVNDKEILNVLKGNNITKLKEILTGPNRDFVLDLAGIHSSELSQLVIQEIEDFTGISLSHD